MEVVLLWRLSIYRGCICMVVVFFIEVVFLWRLSFNGGCLLIKLINISALPFCNKKYQIHFRTPQRPQPVFNPQQGLYKVYFLLSRVNTLCFADSLILILRLVDQTICLDQLYSCTIIMLSSLCTPVQNFVVTSAHNLLGPVCVTT